MKRTLITLQLIVAAMILVASNSFAVPNLISYQGFLNDSQGQPVTNTLSMTFKIYDAETGGNELWSEAQSVQVSNGEFNVQLGTVQALTSTVFQTDTLYLGVSVGADPEMVPRQRITSGGYAKKAETVSQLALPVGTIMSWAKSMPNTPPLEGVWVECNGQTLSDPESPYDGQAIPNLNGENRFLKGSTSSGAVGGATSHNHYSPLRIRQSGLYVGIGGWGQGSPNFNDHYMYLDSAGGSEVFAKNWQIGNGFAGSNYNTYKTSVTETTPPHYEVVWIIKVK